MKYFSAIEETTGKKVLIPTSNILVGPDWDGALTIKIEYQGTIPGKRSRYRLLLFPLPGFTPLNDAINLIKQAIIESLSTDQSVIDTGIICIPSLSINI